MKTPPVSVREVEAILASTSKEFDSNHPPTAVAVVADPTWDGPAQLESGGHTFTVAPCISVLAVREALSDATAPLVILSPFGKEQLGTDVAARIAKGRPLSSDRKDAVLQLFGAAVLEPELSSNRPLIDLLVVSAPSGGYPRVAGRALTIEHAVRALAVEHLGLTDINPTAPSLLAWIDEDQNRTRVINAPDQLVRLLFEDIFPSSVSFAPTLLSTINTEKGRAADLVALGLVAGAVGSAPNGEQRGAAKTNLRSYLGQPFVDVCGQDWKEAADAVLEERASLGQDTTALEMQADEILLDVEGHGLAGETERFPSSFSKAFATLGRRLVESVDGGADGPLLAALKVVEQHQLSSRYVRRVNQARMAVRLVEWLSTSYQAKTLAEHGVGYRNHGAWVDFARRTIRAEQDPEPDLAFAYDKIIAVVDERRESENKSFAEALSAWDQGPSPSIIGIERALDEVVVPVAATSPVLLLVMDGMGWDVWHELRADLERRGWFRVLDENKSVDRSCFAAFPTVTELSRTSLLTGQLAKGDQSTEKRLFPKHPALVATSSKSKPPMVFHKGDVSRSDGGGLSEEAVEALQDTGRQIVACVVNAIDDHLLKGDQVRPPWIIDNISPLGLLLDTASSSDRTIIVTADHGHVLDVDTEATVIKGAKERWRPATGEQLEHEVTIAGSRTLAADGKVYMPWADQVRYSSSRRNGYHGGATPQEVLVPLDVMTKGEPAEGWIPASHTVPNWWSLGVDRVEPASAVQPAKETAAFPERSDGQASLFCGDIPDVPATGWPTDLFASEVFVIQYESQSGRNIELDRLRLIIRSLDTNGNRLTRHELAVSTGIPEARLGGVLAQARRVLNIDGYAVLSDDGEVVILDQDTARAQFGLG